MVVTFWGVRGSIPAPGGHTLRYGGNTSCVSVEKGGTMLVLDAGTGIRHLGGALWGSGHEIYLLLSHIHSDHIYGLPFFAPLHEPGRTIHLIDYVYDGQRFSPLTLLDGVHFPVTADELPSDVRRVHEDAGTYLRSHGWCVRSLPLNHPGGGFGYRVEDQGRAFVYIPDNELDGPANTANTTFDDFVAFCRGADVLCHDAQYLVQDMPFKHGWGHSLVDQVCGLAVAAGVRHLVLFHHDPDRSDDELDALYEGARLQLEPHGIACSAAREGLVLTLEDVPTP